jgi:ABC-2 type transport system permease protein
MQNEVVGEKRSGTAAWILSKPISRPAFLVAKLLADALGIAVTMVLAQGVIAYVITGVVVGDWLSPLAFLAALGAHLTNILFYLALTLMLGVLFEHPAPVIGIPMAFLFAQNFLGGQLAQIHPALAHVLPWSLAIPVNGGGPDAKSVAMALAAGQPTPLTAVYVALVAAALFVAIGIAVFQRQEL